VLDGGDYRLSKEELLELWSKISDVHNPEVVSQQVDVFLDKCDKTDDGFITYNEFIRVQKELKGEEHFQKLSGVLSGFLAKKKSDPDKTIKEQQFKIQQLEQDLQRINGQKELVEKERQKLEAELEEANKRAQEDQEAAIEACDEKDKEINELRTRVEELEARSIEEDDELTLASLDKANAQIEELFIILEEKEKQLQEKENILRLEIERRDKSLEMKIESLHLRARNIDSSSHKYLFVVSALLVLVLILVSLINKVLHTKIKLVLW